MVPMLIMCLLAGLEHHPLTRRVVGGHEPDALQRLINLPALGRLTGDIADADRDRPSGAVRCEPTSTPSCSRAAPKRSS